MPVGLLSPLPNATRNYVRNSVNSCAEWDSFFLWWNSWDWDLPDYITSIYERADLGAPVYVLGYKDGPFYTFVGRCKVVFLGDFAVLPVCAVVELLFVSEQDLKATGLRLRLCGVLFFMICIYYKWFGQIQGLSKLISRAYHWYERRKRLQILLLQKGQEC